MFSFLKSILILPVAFTGTFFPITSQAPIYNGKTLPFYSGMRASGIDNSGRTTSLSNSPRMTTEKIDIGIKKIPPRGEQTLRSPFIVIPEIRSDANTDIFVSKQTSLSNTGYVPKDLISIAHPYIDEAGRHSELREEAAEALWKLSVAFYKKFHTSIVVVSGYRSAAYQQRLWNLGRCSDTLCAPAGHSEHQLGLAVDLFDASTKNDYLANAKFRSYVTWLGENAHLYGWHQSYQK